MNFLEQFFFTIAVFMFVVGIIANYGERFIPSMILQIFRYGRANKSEKPKTRLIKSIEVPKSWFAHFYLYATGLQILILYSIISVYTSENPVRNAQSSLLARILSLVGGEDRAQTVDATTTLVGSALFTFQVSRRLYECWFVSVYSGTKMNLLHYFLAFFHYTGSALSIVAHSAGFSGPISSSQPDFVISSSCEWKLCYKRLNIFHIVGLLIFLYGSYEQNRAHQQYADLRKGKKNEVVSFAHRIPGGGLFEKVSCPNYWAEIIVYSSFCILFQGANSTWNCVFLWVASNQIIAGIMNHRWYQKTFPDYPKNRKAIIPYVW